MKSLNVGVRLFKPSYTDMMMSLHVGPPDMMMSLHVGPNMMIMGRYCIKLKVSSLQA